MIESCKGEGRRRQSSRGSPAADAGGAGGRRSRPRDQMTARAARALAFAGLLVHAAFCPISIAGTQIGLGIAAVGVATGIAAGFRPARTPLDVPLLALIAVCTASDLLSPYGPPPLAFATLWRS